MKRFDLRQIMRDAHRTYKYVGKKQGKTFGEVLKSTWKLAKLNVTMYNPQNEMFRLLGTKRSFSQNETFFFSHP